MKRLTRAIVEMESFRNALIHAPWKGASEMTAIGLLNSAIMALTQVEALTMFRGHISEIDTRKINVSKLIREANAEADEESKL